MTEQQKRAYIRTLVNNTNQRIIDTYKYFDDVIEKAINPYKNKSDFEKGWIWIGSGIYDLLEGGWEAVTGSVSAMLVTSANFWENLTNQGAGGVPGGNLTDASVSFFRGEDVGTVLSKFDWNNALEQQISDLSTGLQLAGVSIGATAQNLTSELLKAVGVQTNWNTQWATDATRGLVALNAREAYYRRSGEADLLSSRVRTGSSQDEISDVVLQDAIDNYEKYSKYLEESANPEFVEYVDMVNNIKKNVDKLVDNEFLRTTLNKNAADLVFANNEIYQAVSGTIKSMAAVLTSKLIAGLAPAAAAPIVANLFFSSQVLGNSFVEARENGATIRDAWMYAVTIASIETLVEQIGGLKPGSNVLPKITDFDAVVRFFKTVGKNAFEEGVEEIASEFLTPAFDIYKLKPEEQMDPSKLERLQEKDTMKRLFLAFASGAVSGGIFGGFQYLRNRNTLTERINLWQEAQQLQINEKNKDKVIATVAKQARSLVATLNNPKAKGYNSKGKLVTLTTQDKMAYIVQSGLGNLVNIDWQNSVVKSGETADVKEAIQLGEIQFKLNPNISFGETLYKARFGVNPDDSINYIDSSKYAMNKATEIAGVDLENVLVGEGENRPFTIATKETTTLGVPLNDVGLMILKMAEEYKIPVVVVAAKDDNAKIQESGRVAFYLNGVIYINQDAKDITKEQIRSEIARHEIVHLLAKNNPKIYQEIADIVDGVLEVTLDFKKMEVIVTAKKGQERLFEFLNKNGFVEKVQAAFNQILKQQEEKIRKEINLEALDDAGTNKLFETVVQKISEQLKEEIVAYFIETSVKDTDSFLNALKGVAPGLMGRFQALLQEQNIIAEQTKGMTAAERTAVKRAFRTLAKGVTETVRKTRTVGFLIEKALGGDLSNAEYVFSPEAITKYGEKALMDALVTEKIRRSFGLETATEVTPTPEQVDNTKPVEGTPLTKKTFIKVKNLETGALEEVALEDILIFDADQILNKVSGQPDEKEQRKQANDYINNFSLAEVLPKIITEEEKVTKINNITQALRRYKTKLKNQLETYEVLLQGINISDSVEREEILKKRLRTEKRLLFTEAIRFVLNLYLEVDYRSKNQPIVTKEQAELILQQFLTGTTELSSEIVDELRREYGDWIVDTALIENEVLELLAGRKGTFKLDIKNIIIGRALVYADMQVTGVNQPGSEPVRIGTTVKSADTTAQIKAVTTIFSGLKRFLQLYSPIPQFRTAAWVNSGWRTVSIDSPGALSLTLDLSNEILKGETYDGQKNPDYIKTREDIIDGYSALLDTIFSGSVKYTNSNGDTNIRTFNRDDWDYIVEGTDDVDGRPLSIEIFIYPTEQLIQKQIEKTRLLEESRIQAVKKTAEKAKSYTINEAQSTMNELIEGVIISAFSQPNIRSTPQIVEQQLENIRFVLYALNSALPLDILTKVLPSYIEKKIINPNADLSNTDSRGKIISPSQKEFFKDTILKTKEGSLITMYHGSEATFDSFTFRYLDTNGLAGGPGFYFADTLETSSTYSGESDTRITPISIENQEGIKTRPFYLNIKKPMVRLQLGEFQNGYKHLRNGVEISVDKNAPLKINLHQNNGSAAIPVFTKEEVKKLFLKLSEKTGLTIKQLVLGSLYDNLGAYDIQKDEITFNIFRFYDEIKEIINDENLKESDLLDQVIKGTIGERFYIIPIFGNRSLYAGYNAGDNVKEIFTKSIGSQISTYLQFLRKENESKFLEIVAYVSENVKEFKAPASPLSMNETDLYKMSVLLAERLKEGNDADYEFTNDVEKLPNIPPFSFRSAFRTFTSVAQSIGYMTNAFKNSSYYVDLSEKQVSELIEKGVLEKSGVVTRKFTSLFLEALNEATGYDGVLDYREDYEYTSALGDMSPFSDDVSEDIMTEFLDAAMLRSYIGNNKKARIHYIVWNQNQIKSTMNYMPVEGGSPYESYEEENTDIFKENTQKTYSENQVAIVIPESFTANGVRQAIIQAEETSPSMVLMVPLNVITTRKAQTVAIPDDYKIVSARIPDAGQLQKKSLDLNIATESRVRELRYGFMHIAKKQLKAFESKKDLRLANEWKLTRNDINYKYFPRPSNVTPTFLEEMNKGLYDNLYSFVVELSTSNRYFGSRYNSVRDFANPETKKLITEGKITNFVLLGTTSKTAFDVNINDFVRGEEQLVVREDGSFVSYDFLRKAFFSTSLSELTLADILKTVEEKQEEKMGVAEEPMSKVSTFEELTDEQKKFYKEIYDSVNVNTNETTSQRRFILAPNFLKSEGKISLEKFSNGLNIIPYIDDTDESETKTPEQRIRLFAVVNYRGIRIPFYTSTIETKEGVGPFTWYNHLGVTPGKEFDQNRIAFINELNTELHRAFGGSPMILAISEYLGQEIWNFSAFGNDIEEIMEEITEGVRPNFMETSDIEIINSGYDVEKTNAYYIPTEKLKTEFTDRVKPLDEQFVLDVVQDPGYLKSQDIARQLIKYAEDNYEPEEPFNKVSSPTIDPKETEAIKKLFGDYFFNKGLQVNSKGKYVLVNKGLYGTVAANEVNLEIPNIGYKETISGSTHAINIPYGKHDINVNIKLTKGFRIVKLSELTPKQRVLYDFLVSTGISFALYEEKSNALGFSMPQDTFNISFLKASTMERAFIAETIFHENFHEIFKQDPVLANNYGVLVADLIFESPGVLSDFGKELFMAMAKINTLSRATTGEEAFNDFIQNYLKQSYAGGNAVDTLSKAEKVLREPAKINQALTQAGLSKKNAAIVTPIKNEFLAQITGFIMADRYFVEKFLNVSNVDSSVKMFQLVSNLIGNPSVPTNTKMLAESVLAEYSDLTKKLQNKMLALYPNKPSYSNADINEFIRIFTEGKYTTKSALIKAYMTERYSNKEKGEATLALNNIIFVASSYAKAAKNSASVFIELENELKKLLDGSYFLLTSEFKQSFGALSPLSMKLYLSGVKKYAKVFDLLVNGKLFSRVLLDNGLNLAQSGMDLNATNTIYIIDFLSKLYDKMETLAEFLIDVPQELLDTMFSKEEIDEIPMLLQALRNQLDLIDEAIKEINDEGGEENYDFTSTVDSKGNMRKLLLLSQLLSTNPLLTSKFLEKVATLNALAKAKVKTPVGVQAILATTMDEKNRTTINLLYNKLKSATQKAVIRLSQKPLQDASPLSPELKAFLKNLKSFEGILTAVFMGVETNRNTIIERVKDVLKEFALDYTDVVTVKYKTEDEAEFEEEIEGDLSRFRDFVIAIYINMSKLFGDESIMLSIPSALASNEEIKNLMKTKEYQQYVYNSSKVVNAFSGLIKLLETRYTTSLSDDNQTHNEFAEEKIAELETALDGEQAKDADIENVSVMTPQDYFRFMIKKHGKTTNLFEILYNKYKQSVKRYEDITVDFDKRYLSFKKLNPNIQKFSISEQIDLDPSVFAQIDPNTMNSILTEYNGIAQAEEAALENNKTETEKIKKLQSEARVEVEKFKKELAKKTRGSLGYKQVQAQLRNARENLRQINKQLRDLKQDKKGIEIKRVDKTEFVKTKIAEKLQQRGKKFNNKISLGQLVVLYLSIKREIEMAEIYKKANENGDISDIKPTNHFGMLNLFVAFDNEVLRKKGLEAAKDESRNFVILQEKSKLVVYLEQIINTYPEAEKMIQFATDSFNKNYEYLNEQFKQRYKRELPKQTIYIPFATIDSEYKREINLKLVRRNNAGVAQGLVTETTLGATVPLKIENIFSVIENHSRATARYSFDRLLKDFQNLWVNRGGKGGASNLSQLFTGADTPIGKGNKFYNKFIRMFIDILGYNPVETSWAERFIQRRLRDLRAATLSFGLGSPIKQLGSISNIAIKNGLSLPRLIINVTKNLVFDLRRAKANSIKVTDVIEWIKTIYSSKFFKYLMDNNSNFYLRAKVSNIPDLAREINSSVSLQSAAIIEKINKLGLLPMQLLDTAVLLGAFETIYEKKVSELKKKGLTGSNLEQTALAEANVDFEEVLLFGVANTSAAYRSQFSNDRTTFGQLISRFQSENVLHISAILREIALIRAGVPGRVPELLKEILAWIISGLYSAIVNSAFALAYGYTTVAALAAGEFLFQELLIDNMLGSIPIVNQLTALFQLDFEDGLKLREGYGLRIPLVSEVQDVISIISSGFVNEDTGEFSTRKVVRILTKLSSVFGLPLNNLDKIGRLLAGAFASSGDGWAIDLVQWYRGTSDSQEFTNSIKTGNSTFIQAFATQAFENTGVVNHITELLASDRTLRLSLKNEDYFIFTNKDGERERKDIPPAIKTRYRRLTTIALQQVIRNTRYRRLNSAQKVAVLQRIINYFYNYMKDVVLRKKQNIVSTTTAIREVVERSLYYAYN